MTVYQLGTWIVLVGFALAGASAWIYEAVRKFKAWRAGRQQCSS